ncbi:MAG: EamA family transporter [Spirochaetales bacterium]
MTHYLWLIFALLSAATASLVAIFGKIGLQGIDSNTATAIRAVIMALFLIGVVIAQGKLANVSVIFGNSKAILFIVLSGIAGAVSWVFYFWALKVGKVSQVAPIDRLSMVFAIVLAALFLGEKVSLKAGLGAAIMVAGAILITLG